MTGPSLVGQIYLAILVSTLVASVSADVVPLVNKHYSYPSEIPYQVDTDNLIRGTQTGYNRCNSTTEGQSSLCQTALINSIDDFCLWAPSKPNTTVGETEGEMVAWCSKPGHGTRVIPDGTLKGVQFMKTPDYAQVVGFIDQSQLNLQSSDGGGEMDPHGADNRGNPLGGLVYSNAYGKDTNTYKQVIEWHNFIGSGTFCFKICDPAGPNAAHFCEHIYDRIGCEYNAPNNAKTGVFESCQGDNQDYPGVYTDASGAKVTYTQPPESLGPITTLPYTPRVPASSNCVQYTSSVLYASAASAAPTSSSSSSSSSQASATVSPSKSTTGTGAPAQTSKSKASSTAAIPGVVSFLGAVMGLLLA